ncbi:unnamed protein product [Pedinophyceae sp. YPF-701]|nr:unnamed protein product [Pedinophyceae sp. YPF-701]
MMIAGTQKCAVARAADAKVGGRSPARSQPVALPALAQRKRAERPAVEVHAAPVAAKAASSEPTIAFAGAAVAMGLVGVAIAAYKMGKKSAPAPAPVAAPAAPAPAKAAPAKATAIVPGAKASYLDTRYTTIGKHFPGAMGIEEFVAKCEMALFGQGFTTDNSIALTNICRDESTVLLRNRIEAAYGASFSTQSLGAIPTCGVTGMGAGLSHAPKDPVTGKERYIFWSFPHIAINADGTVGAISRPGRHESGACGALVAALGVMKSGGVDANAVPGGTHDEMDPELAILKQRLAQQLKDEGITDATKMDLVEFTKVAERLITKNMKELIAGAVDPAKADWALITGVQIHNWTSDPSKDHPDLEFVWPVQAQTCINGVTKPLDLAGVPDLTPRQLGLLGAVSECPDMIHEAPGDCGCGVPSAIYREERGSEAKALAEAYNKMLKTAAGVAGMAKRAYLDSRYKTVRTHFPGSMGVEEFVAKSELALFGYGFTGDNSIALTNICRDESTVLLRNRIENVYGASFSTQSLGAIPTCGVTGMGAGLSHAPKDPVTGKERYIFWSFPHIAVDSEGKVGAISRPGRPESGACGALVAALGAMKSSGVAKEAVAPGKHDVMDPELAILKYRLAHQLKDEGVTDASKMDLVEFTKVAERLITKNMRELISKAVDPSKADWALITGVQIHNWTADQSKDDPDLEFVYPVNFTVCTDGVEKAVDLSGVPDLSPRQLGVLSSSYVVPDMVHECGTGCGCGTPTGIERKERSVEGRGEAAAFSALLA